MGVEPIALLGHRLDMAGLRNLVPELNRNSGMRWEWDPDEPTPDLSVTWVELWAKFDEISIQSERCVLRVAPRSAYIYFVDRLFAVIGNPALESFVVGTCQAVARALGAPATAIVPDSGGSNLGVGQSWVQECWSFDEMVQGLRRIAPAVPDLPSMEKENPDHYELGGFALLQWTDGPAGSPATLIGERAEEDGADVSLVSAFDFETLSYHRFYRRMLLTGTVWREMYSWDKARLLLLGVLEFRETQGRGQNSALLMESEWLEAYRAGNQNSPPHICHYRLADSDTCFEALAVSHVLEVVPRTE